ncbi:MAG TPA: nuclear transport factor 2 family protein [Flavilitoribacter sp.]|nr:nuclear transport factor 2 family protein [Flavilitoribacter sp.]HMQ87178.1 nuclear transport factor 2 family protein [Flavilitoribacter sp.]
MKNNIILTILITSTLSLSAQPATLQQEINDQVWKPFLESFNSYDAETFMAVHHPEAIRVIEDADQVLDFHAYGENSRAGFRRGKESGVKRELTLRFTRRIAGEANAFEIGIYRSRIIRPDGTTNDYFGIFHVVLKKRDGRWQIWVDSDTSEGASEEAYLAAEAME